MRLHNFLFAHNVLQIKGELFSFSHFNGSTIPYLHVQRDRHPCRGIYLLRKSGCRSLFVFCAINISRPFLFWLEFYAHNRSTALFHSCLRMFFIWYVCSLYFRALVYDYLLNLFHDLLKKLIELYKATLKNSEIASCLIFLQSWAWLVCESTTQLVQTSYYSMVQKWVASFSGWLLQYNWGIACSLFFRC